MATGDAAVIEPFLSASDAAAHLGLPVRAVIELARDGVLPAIRGPVGAPRFRVTDVRAFRGCRAFPAFPV